jgi:hemolysin III
MVQALVLRERPQSLGEEIANSVSHGLGLLAALTAFPVLVIVAHQRGDGTGIVGASVFATTMVLLYLTSTLTAVQNSPNATRVVLI